MSSVQYVGVYIVCRTNIRVELTRLLRSLRSSRCVLFGANHGSFEA